MPTWVAVVSICGVHCCSITWPIVSWRFQSSVYPPSLSFKFRGIGKLCLDLLFVLLSLDSWNWMLTLNFWLAVHSLHVFGSAELLAFQPFQSFMYTYCLIIWGYLFCLLFASGCLANKVTRVSFWVSSTSKLSVYSCSFNNSVSFNSMIYTSWSSFWTLFFCLSESEILVDDSYGLPRFLFDEENDGLRMLV